MNLHLYDIYSSVEFEGKIYEQYNYVYASSEQEAKKQMEEVYGVDIVYKYIKEIESPRILRFRKGKVYE